MAQVIHSQLPGTFTALTITLNSLGASATVGRQSTPVNSTGTNPFSIAIQGKINVGTVSGNKQILFYFARSYDGGTTYSLENGTNAIGGADAAFTRADPSADMPVKVLPTPTSSIDYSVDFVIEGITPGNWALVVFNDTGASLAGSGNSMSYQEFRAQSN